MLNRDDYFLFASKLSSRCLLSEFHDNAGHVICTESVARHEVRRTILVHHHFHGSGEAFKLAGHDAAL